MTERCTCCGSREIVCLDKNEKKYRCKSCDEIFELADKTEAFQAKRGLTPTEIYKRANGSVFELKCWSGNTVSQGTGFYISSDGYIITNCHVVIVRGSNGKFTLCNEICLVSPKTGDEIPLSIEYIDHKNDLALLKQKTKSVAPLKLAKKLPDIGSNVVAIGNSIGQGLCIVDGIVSDLDREFAGHPAFLFNALVTHGCSGGPVFDENGEVCGVTVGGLPEAEGMKYAIPLQEIKQFIEEIKKDGVKL